ncbi:hypothetical protein C8R44DRAFT_728037 [Mycena epipterygia]|nr:hypothetical protein C8R44DRAFT_728037 [Mycena epipterygia]
MRIPTFHPQHHFQLVYQGCFGDDTFELPSLTAWIRLASRPATDSEAAGRYSPGPGVTVLFFKEVEAGTELMQALGLLPPTPTIESKIPFIQADVELTSTPIMINNFFQSHGSHDSGAVDKARNIELLRVGDSIEMPQKLRFPRRK